MKIIRAKDITEIDAELVQPGDVLIEGVVISKTVGDDHVLLRCAHGTIAAGRNERLQVLAKLDELARRAVVETVG